MSFNGLIDNGMYCDVHGKRGFTSRSSAKKWARVRHRGENVSEYPCQALDGMWHIGHMPNAVKQGLMTREDLGLTKEQRMDKIAKLNQEINGLRSELAEARLDINTLVKACEDAATALRQCNNTIDQMADEIQRLRDANEYLDEKVREIGG